MRTDVVLLSEEEFTKRNPAADITIKVSIPNDPEFGQWNFIGQMLQLTLRLADPLQALKDKLKSMLGNMPDKKMKINIADGPFLNKDEKSFAFYNIGNGTILQLGVKERGGRKK